MRMLAPHPDTPEHLSEAGARHLAKRISDYWTKQNLPAPKFRIEPFGPISTKAAGVFAVRSDMLNGLPRS